MQIQLTLFLFLIHYYHVLKHYALCFYLFGRKDLRMA